MLKKTAKGKGLKSIFKKLIGHIGKTHFLILLIISLVGLYLRLEPAIFDTVHFSYDQGDDFTEVRRLLIDHQPSLIGRASGLQGVFMGPLWTWLLAVPYMASGGNPAGSVVFFALLGTAAIWITYLLVKKILNPQAALITALYTALSFNFVGAAQIVLSPNPLAYLEILHLWLLWEIIENKKDNLLPWLALVLGLFFQFEIAFALLLLPSTVLVLICFRREKAISKSLALKAILIFFLTFLPQIIFELRHDFLMSRALVGVFQGTNKGLGSENADFFQRLIFRAVSLKQDFLSATVLTSQPLASALLALPLSLFGWYLIYKDREIKFLKFAKLLFFLTVFIYFLFAVYPGPIWVWYRAGMPIIFILPVAIGWSKIISQNRFGKILAALLFFSFTLFNIHNQLIITKISNYPGNASTLRNQKLVIDKIFTDAQTEAFDLYVYTPPVYTYVWDHLLFWYAKPKYPNYPINYGYQVKQPPSGNFYLIIEPDDMQFRIDGWKGNFVSLGEPVRVWKLTGGITVEQWSADRRDGL